MRALLVLIVLIRAILPMSEEIKERAEELRQVAIKAGCQEPRLLMYSEGSGLIEIEVSCE